MDSKRANDQLFFRHNGDTAMNHKIEINHRGVTLVELIFVISLISIISIFLVNVVMTSQNSMAVQNTAVPVWAEARQTLDAITKELRAADPSASGGISIGGSGNTQDITFRIPNQVSTNGAISWTKVKFHRDSTSKEIRRTVNDVTMTVLGRDAEVLQFTNPSANVYKATLQIQKVVSGGTDTITSNLSSEVKVRN